MSRSTSSRPSSSSRTAPPTTQASVPSSSSRASSSIDDRPPGAAWVGFDPADELVVDRPGHASVRLGQHAVPEDRHRRPDRLLLLERYRERVHRDRPDDFSGLAAAAYLDAGQVAAEAVRVADG